MLFKQYSCQGCPSYLQPVKQTFPPFLLPPSLSSSYRILLFLFHDKLQTRTKPAFQGRNHVFNVGVQFVGLGYYTEQNTDGIPSFVDCSLLRNGIHNLHQKSWGGPSNFFGGSGPPDPPVVAPLLR